jgi:hypothetical protein
MFSPPMAAPPAAGLSAGGNISCTAPVAMLGALDAKKVAGLAYQAGFRDDDVSIAVAIARAESQWNPDAVNDQNTNGSTDYGLMQINSVHQSLLATGNWRDPFDNMQMAFQVFTDAGGHWTPWSTYNSGSYRQYLTTVEGCATTTLTDPGAGPQGADGLRPRAENVKAIALKRWPSAVSSVGGYSYRLISGTGTLSDHATGRAADIMLGADYKSPSQREAGFAISRYFADNAKALGVKYVIYYDEINDGSGWRPYSHPGGVKNDVFQHRNHIHVSVY